MQPLLKSRSSERVLLFLLVNEQCYPHQLFQALDLALSPIQNTLQRLEKGGILVSKKEGSRLLYQFNPLYPLIDELKRLLQKAFGELSIEEKKMYYTARAHKHLNKVGRESLNVIWKALGSVSRVKLIASSPSWNGMGEGDVEVIERGSSLEWVETGRWKGAQTFRNHFRFTFLRQQAMLAMEHLRFGEKRAQFLFHLILKRPGLLESTDPHLGGKDAYLGRLQYNPLFIEFLFKTIGPKKYEKIESIYT